MSSARKHQKRIIQRAERDLAVYVGLLRKMADVADPGLVCRCCEKPALWVHRADGSPWCGCRACQTASDEGLTTRERGRPDAGARLYFETDGEPLTFLPRAETASRG